MPEDETTGEDEEKTLHISDVDQEIRSEVRESLETSVESVFMLADIEAAIDEIYVYGSFAEGEAVLGESDLDVRVSVDCDKTSIQEVIQIERKIRTTLSSEITDGSPFRFVDPKLVRAGSEKATGEVVL